MANSLYGKAREAFLAGNLDWDANNIKVALIDTGSYTVSIDTDEFLSTIPGGAIVATSGNLANKTAALGTADADDISFGAVSGATAEALVVYADSGVSASSRLIAYIDTATGLPVTPNGGVINVTWDNGTNRIFRL